MRRPLIAFVVAVAVLVPAGMSRAAATDFTVKAGAVDPNNALAPFEYTRFYPESLQVHRGQIVAWRFYGFHSVEFLPQNADPPSLFRLDDIPNALALNETFAFDGGCGSDGENACDITNTTTRYGSGANPMRAAGGAWTATIDLPQGTYNYICAVHATMRGQIEVVDDTISIPAQSDIDAQVASEVAADTDEAVALENDQSQHVVPDGAGHSIWTVRVGPDTPSHHVNLLAYLPATVPAHAGDSVHFVAGDDNTINNAHSVTFPAQSVGDPEQSPVPGSPVPGGLSGAFAAPACELDGESGPLPGIPGLVICPGSQEVLAGPHIYMQQRAPGDSILTPATFHNSGIMVPARGPINIAIDPQSGQRFPSTFNAVFPVQGTFQYACLLHGADMVGAITVA